MPESPGTGGPDLEQCLPWVFFFFYLGFLFNSINIYYFVQALGEVLLSLPIPPSLEDFAFCHQDERKGTQRPAAPGLLVKGPTGTSEST